MEFQFDLMSFVLGGAAATLSLLLAKLLGYLAALAYCRLFDRGTPPEMISMNDMVQSPVLASGSISRFGRPDFYGGKGNWCPGAVWCNGWIKP